MKYFCLIVLVLCCACSNNISSYRVPQYEKDVDVVTDRVAKEIHRTTGLKLMGTGGGLIDQINRLGMSFARYGDLSMEEARELLVYCIEEYLEAINANEKIRPHLCCYPFTPNNVEIIIFIYREDRRRPPVGFLTVVAGAYGKMIYKIQQPGFPSMKDIHEEPYDEAKKLVEQQDPGMEKIKKS
ncbi:MAG TPA: hypothetical protein PKW79_04150 [Rhabdochlamydiaceae bacterium]|nr:hypothetical protein [Rhabdochlamydiaceae bacterium]